jgi:hypothetical protein
MISNDYYYNQIMEQINKEFKPNINNIDKRKMIYYKIIGVIDFCIKNNFLLLEQYIYLTDKLLLIKKNINKNNTGA